MSTAAQSRWTPRTDESLPALTGNGRDTSRLKETPQPRTVRDRIAERVERAVQSLDKSRPPGRSELEAAARHALADLSLPEAYLGWTMVVAASAFWREQAAAVPFHRRLVLLPRCLRDAATCDAPCDAAGLHCRGCGACALDGLRAKAEGLGCRVVVAEGSPAVMRMILAGEADAVLGVACLDALENTLDKVLLAGVPSMAVPLLGNGCRDTSVDEDWVLRMIETPHRPARQSARTYLHLMRAAAGMFAPAELGRLLTPLCGSQFLSPPDDLDPLLAAEAIACGFLAAGGKRSRPFITLAVYDAMSGSGGTRSDGAEAVAQLPDAVKRVALAIEVFHKASLVHDDVEDDDPVRYGLPAVHRKHGVAAAINAGDYLIGLGYRLAAGVGESLGAETAADVIAKFAHAHTRLCEGQGAELRWRDSPNKDLAPLDALKIAALKTSPAFEAAMLSGARLAGPVGDCREPICRFARHLGVAYQILNDLDDWGPTEPSHRSEVMGGTNTDSGRNDWRPLESNDRPRGTDLLGGRPTVLWALALAGLAPPARRELLSLPGSAAGDEQALDRARELYAEAGAFQRASSLVAKHRQRARLAAQDIPAEPLRHLMYFLADVIVGVRDWGLGR